MTPAGEWEKTKVRVVKVSPAIETLYDSWVNPVNIAAVLIHLLIVVKL